MTHAENRVGAGAGPIGAAGGSTTGIGWGLGAETMFVAGLGRSVAQTFGPEIAYGKHDPIGRDRPSASSGTAVSLGARGGISLVF